MKALEIASLKMGRMPVFSNVGDCIVRHFLNRVGTEHVQQLKTTLEHEPLVTDDVVLKLAFFVGKIPVDWSGSRRRVLRGTRKRGHFSDEPETFASYLSGGIRSPRRRVAEVVVNVTLVEVELSQILPVIFRVVVIVVAVGRGWSDLVRVLS
jgi:hypothetical protein